MTKRRNQKAITATTVKNGDPAVTNSLADAIGIGGGINPIGYPYTQGVPGTAQVENVGTIFRNLRWYLISNMRQVLNEAYVELGLVQTICDVPVDDGLRGGIEITTNQLDPEQVDELYNELDRADDLNIAGQAAKWNRLFGGAGVLVLTDQDPEEPLDVESLTADSHVEFRAVDMWELFGDQQNIEGYEPVFEPDKFEYFNYYSERVHKSRVFPMKGLEAPSFIRPRLRGWGFSVVEILVRSINQYLKGTDLAFEVLDEFKIDIYKIKGLTQALMSPQGTNAVKERIQMANWQKNYQNALTMDQEDDWDHKQLSFQGLGEAMQQIRMQVAADMRMPLTKLFGISSAGFNSGEDDIEVYNAMVESQVRNKIKYVVLRMVEIKCQTLFGFIPDDLSISFQPLRIMSSEQEETVKSQKFDRVLQSFQAGLITHKQFLEACNTGELLPIKLEIEEGLDGYMQDMVGGDDDGEDDTKAIEERFDEGDEDDETVENSGPIIMPAPYTKTERLQRLVSNSKKFDLKSYEADGGDKWLNPKRIYFFDRDKAKDKELWDKAEQAAPSGVDRKKFAIWWYKKHGGGFF